MSSPYPPEQSGFPEPAPRYSPTPAYQQPSPPSPHELELQRHRTVRSLGNWLLGLTSVSTAAVLLFIVVSVGLIVSAIASAHGSGEFSGTVAELLVGVAALLFSTLGWIFSGLVFLVAGVIVILAIVAAVKARGSGRAGALLIVLPTPVALIAAFVLLLIATILGGSQSAANVGAISDLPGILGVAALLLMVFFPPLGMVIAVIGSIMVRRWGGRSPSKPVRAGYSHPGITPAGDSGDNPQAGLPDLSGADSQR